MKRSLVVARACLALMVPSSALAFDGSGPEVPYEPFDFPGTTVMLHQFTGRHVELLLPDSWLPASGGLTDEQRRILIDRFDIAYEYYVELLGQEPQLSARPNHMGLLRIGVVPIPSYDGVGRLGVREMEIDVDQLEMFRNNILDGFEMDRKLMVHELGHCFDVYRSYLSYDGSCLSAPQFCHAWTDFFDGYLPFYGRARGVRETFLGGERTADEHEAFWTDHTYLPYYDQLSDPDVDWNQCVREETLACSGKTPNITARDTWAGVMHRWAELYGHEAVQRGLSWLANHAATNPTPTVSPEEAERRHILMMAAGAEENISCILDEWQWYAPDTLKAELAMLYGPGASGKCLDYDLDGFSPLQGDCSDSNLDVYPGATEVVNGIDDDCNRYVDDVTPPPPPVLPLDAWGEVLPPEKDGVDFVLSSSMVTLDPTIVKDTPVWIRYWVTGQGVVGNVPYSDEASFNWTPPVNLPAGTYGYRAQLMSNTTIVADWTDLEWFEYGGPCSADLDCDDGDDCSVDECTPSGLCSNVLLQDDVYEAESMLHSTGNAYAGGWNIYSNGYAQFTHDFAGGWQQMTVSAAGQFAAGQWPNMRITVDGGTVYETAVQSSSWSDYTFWINRGAGAAAVRINFTNDYFFDAPGDAPDIDRNLLLDKVMVLAQCGPDAPPTAVNLGPVSSETTYTVTGAQGLVIDALSFGGWTPARIVVGFGQTDGVSMTGMSVSVNGGTPVSLNGNWQTIAIPYTGQTSIQLTVYSSTPRDLRTQWWAEG